MKRIGELQRNWISSDMLRIADQHCREDKWKREVGKEEISSRRIVVIPGRSYTTLCNPDVIKTFALCGFNLLGGKN